MSKPDKLGIHAYIESLAREIMYFVIQAYFSDRDKKREILGNTRISLEILKHFVRIEHELNIIDQKTYIRIESLVIETSKMTNGWIKYLDKTP